MYIILMFTVGYYCSFDRRFGATPACFFRTVFEYCNRVMNSDSAVVFQYLETVVHGSAASESAAGVPYGLPFLISKIDWCHSM